VPIPAQVLVAAGSSERLNELRLTTRLLQATRRSLSDLFRSLRASSPRLLLLADPELFLMLTLARSPEQLQVMMPPPPPLPPPPTHTQPAKPTHLSSSSNPR